MNDWITNLIAFSALVISVMAWRETRRNAKAAEDSAAAAVRSAKAAEDSILAAERNALAAEESAKAAIQSVELTKALNEEQKAKEQAQWQAFRDEHIKRLVKTAYDIKNAVLGKYQMILPGQNVEIDWESIEHIHREPIFTDEQMINYFNEIEREQIGRAWGILQYLFKQFGNDDPERLGISLAGSVIQEFTTLINMFENR